MYKSNRSAPTFTTVAAILQRFCIPSVKTIATDVVCSLAQAIGGGGGVANQLHTVAMVIYWLTSNTT